MSTGVVLIVSERLLLLEGLQRLVEESGLGTMVTASNLQNAKHHAFEVDPDVIIVDRADVKADDLTYHSLWEHPRAKVVVYGWNDDKLVVYSRRTVLPATLQNLISVIRD